MASNSWAARNSWSAELAFSPTPQPHPPTHPLTPNSHQQDDSLGWVELRFASEPVNYGDHDVVICEVTDWHTPEPKAAAEAAAEARPLYTRHLRQLGLLP